MAKKNRKKTETKKTIRTARGRVEIARVNEKAAVEADREVGTVEEKGVVRGEEVGIGVIANQGNLIFIIWLFCP